MEARDDVSGGYLDPVEIKKARATEINWVREQKIYEIVPRQMCYTMKQERRRYHYCGLIPTKETRSISTTEVG